MDLGLKDKVVIITGGSSGIGAATALAFAAEGSKVAICARTASDVNALIATGRDRGFDIYGESVDVTNTDQLGTFVENVVKKYGSLNIMFNNAGAGNSVYLMDLTREQWDKCIAVNLTAVWEGCKFAVPHIKAAGGGSIVSTTSLAARIPSTRRAIYAIAKAGVSSMTAMLASELAKDNIRVNAVSPGVVMSVMVKRSMDLDPNYDHNYLTRSAMMQRLGEPEEVAGGVLFLCSDMASFITGEVLDISGGKFRVQDPWCSWER